MRKVTVVALSKSGFEGPVPRYSTADHWSRVVGTVHSNLGGAYVGSPSCTENAHACKFPRGSELVVLTQAGLILSPQEQEGGEGGLDSEYIGLSFLQWKSVCRMVTAC